MDCDLPSFERYRMVRRRVRSVLGRGDTLALCYGYIGVAYTGYREPTGSAEALVARPPVPDVTFVSDISIAGTRRLLRSRPSQRALVRDEHFLDRAAARYRGPAFGADAGSIDTTLPFEATAAIVAEDVPGRLGLPGLADERTRRA